MTKSLPTDLQILDAIYRRHYAEYARYSKGDESRSSKIYMPIDIEKIAQDLKIDVDIVFGRLYYHLEHKYGYEQNDDASVHFFALRIGEDIHCVNFPLMASVLADLQDRSWKHNVAIGFALASLFVSLISILISILFRT